MLAGELPGQAGRAEGELVRESGPWRWDDAEVQQAAEGSCGTVTDLRGRRGRGYPLEYLLALPLAAGMAGDGELRAIAEWAAGAPAGLLVKLGAPLDGEGGTAAAGRDHARPRSRAGLRPGRIR